MAALPDFALFMLNLGGRFPHQGCNGASDEGEKDGEADRLCET
jgi:hypothetical protein